MDIKTYKKYEKMALDGEMPDSHNPIFILNGLPTELLLKIANGEIDVKALAKIELEENRMINLKGKNIFHD